VRCFEKKRRNKKQTTSNPTSANPIFVEKYLFEPACAGYAASYRSKVSNYSKPRRRRGQIDTL